MPSVKSTSMRRTLAVGVLAAAGLAACGSTEAGAPPPGPASSAPRGVSASALEGKWVVERVVTRGRTRAVSLPRAPYVEFRRDGTLRGFDAVNFFSGRYRLVGDEVRTEEVASTLVGLTDRAPALLVEVRAAFGPLVSGRPVSVEIHRRTMELHTGPSALVAARD